MPKRWPGKTWDVVAHSLAGRLLLLTILFVMVSEALIFFPAIGRFWRNQLDTRIEMAEVAILPFTELQERQLSAGTRRELLTRAGAIAVMLQRPDQHELFLADEMPRQVDLTIDMRRTGLFDAICEAVESLIEGDNRLLHVLAPTRIRGAETIEVIVREAPIRRQVASSARRLLVEALLTSIATGVLVFLSLYYVVVRPMARLMRGMTGFRTIPKIRRDHHAVGAAR